MEKRGQQNQTRQSNDNNNDDNDHDHDNDDDGATQTNQTETNQEASEQQNTNNNNNTLIANSSAHNDDGGSSDVEDNVENEENLHERLHKQKHKHRHRNPNHHHHHHHHHHPRITIHHHDQDGHIKELIKPDLTVRRVRASPPAAKMTDQQQSDQSDGGGGADGHHQASSQPVVARRIATAVDEEQLHKRLVESKSVSSGVRKSGGGATGSNSNGSSSSSSSGAEQASASSDQGKIIKQTPMPAAAAAAAAAVARRTSSMGAQENHRHHHYQFHHHHQRQLPRNANTNDKAAAARQKQQSPQPEGGLSQNTTSSTLSSSNSSSSQIKTHSSSTRSGADNEVIRSPPPAAIIIPPNVAQSLSARTAKNQQQSSTSAANLRHSSEAKTTAELSSSSSSSQNLITREQLEYGPLLKTGEIQVLYRSPESESHGFDRHLKEEQAKQVAPNLRQSPISIMSMNPTYELQNKPLIIEYPATVENLKLNNTGFSWQVKIPYQISMTTSLYGAHLNTAHRYRLDQFHCHWGQDDSQGSEHTVDNRYYSAEIHFVHYNMEKYHTFSKAARHPDGLVVLSVFLDAQENHHNHAELEKIVSHLKAVPLKGEHSIIKQAVRIENLLPANKSYWSYQGSMTTPPYFESVTWFVLKHPIICSIAQIQKFRSLKPTLRNEDDGAYIRSNNRKTQPLNGRTIVNYDEHLSSRANSLTRSSSSHAH